MPRLKAYLMFGLFTLLGMAAGCTSEPRAQLKPETFVGEYVYYSADKDAPHNPDRLTLGADGKYILVHMPGGHPALTEDGVWRLDNEPVPNILLGHSGYPVKIKGKDVRLLINDDLGQWYEKT
jgi:hypothetical protein